MKTIFKVLILTLLTSNAAGQAGEKLYPIPKGELWGYIDQTGKTIIKPQFYVAGQFSEGLAPVRSHGTYGYIDRTGTFIIPPTYDLALSFDHGQAAVFIDGKPFFIDKKGHITFQHHYRSISTFGNSSFGIVVTQTNKRGVINKNGELLVDTIFKRIDPFIDGRAVVFGLNHLPYTNDSIEEEVYEVGIIDSVGNWIVPYGRYEDIGDFKNGYAKVELWQPTEVEHAWSNHEAIIDAAGKERFVIPARKFHFDYGNEGFYNDVAVVSIYSVDVDTVEVWSSGMRTDYRGVINTDGKILFSDTSWRKLTPFAFNRAFVLDGSGKWKLINKNGKQVGSSTFDEILYDTYDSNPDKLFTGGIALVKISKGWVAIDTTGKILTDPKSFDEVNADLSRFGKVILLAEDISVENPQYDYRYGFWNIMNNVIVNPIYHNIDINNLDDNLIYVMQDGRPAYITPTGQQVWKAGSMKKGDAQLNIDYINRGYYYAASKYKKDLAGLGGWGKSDNQSKSVSPEVKKSGDQLQVIIDPNKKTTWSEHYQGMKLFVANFSKDTLYFPAQDSRLYLRIQAQDKKGIWKDIEYLPSSWCGNSYHTLFLAPNELWEFATPIYHGAFKTKIRAQLLYKKTKDAEEEEGEEAIIYSNEMDGSINPGQFWNKREYAPNGIMDPYND